MVTMIILLVHDDVDDGIGVGVDDDCEAVDDGSDDGDGNDGGSDDVDDEGDHVHYGDFGNDDVYR